ncbi:MAG TPA: hypothetical protein VJ787_13005 [Thermoleophilia bacterium]|nr:hypothetical protein [Thermoleophilia bacterium]
MTTVRYWRQALRAEAERLFCVAWSLRAQALAARDLAVRCALLGVVAMLVDQAAAIEERAEAS